MAATVPMPLSRVLLWLCIHYYIYIYYMALSKLAKKKKTAKVYSM